MGCVVRSEPFLQTTMTMFQRLSTLMLLFALRSPICLGFSVSGRHGDPHRQHPQQQQRTTTASAATTNDLASVGWLDSTDMSQILIHWKGEDVEGYSLQFRHDEFLGALAAVIGTSLKSLYNVVSFQDALSYRGSDMPDHKRLRYNSAMQYMTIEKNHDQAITRAVLMQATERCSLVHAIYEVVAHADTYDQLCQDAMDNGGFKDCYVGGENGNATWCIRAREYGQESIEKQHRSGDRTRSTTKERKALNALKPVLLLFGGGVDLKKPDTKIYVFDGLMEGDHVLARRMTTGARVSSINPNTRICVTNTPLCPIAAFTMCNVAGLRQGQTVLDPYVGSGAILLAAAMLEPSCLTVGIEIAHNGLVNRDDVRRDFATRNLREPAALIHGDSTLADIRAQARQAIGDAAFDFIITDPPYGIRESTIAMTPINELLLAIAQDRKAGTPLLRKGGKLVCFIPCQEHEEIEEVMPTQELMEDAGVVLEIAREQPLNTKLSRWMVSFICVK